MSSCEKLRPFKMADRVRRQLETGDNTRNVDDRERRLLKEEGRSIRNGPSLLFLVIIDSPIFATIVNVVRKTERTIRSDRNVARTAN